MSGVLRVRSLSMMMCTLRSAERAGVEELAGLDGPMAAMHRVDHRAGLSGAVMLTATWCCFADSRTFAVWLDRVASAGTGRCGGGVESGTSRQRTGARHGRADRHRGGRCAEALSIKNGSGDRLKVSLRWGRNRKARQMRLMAMGLSSVARASERVSSARRRRGRLQGGDDQLFDLRIGNGSWRPAAGGSSGRPSSRSHTKRGAPRVDSCRRQPQASGDRLVVVSGRAGQGDARPPRQLRGGARSSGQGLQVLSLGLSPYQGSRWASGSHAHPVVEQDDTAAQHV